MLFASDETYPVGSRNEEIVIRENLVMLAFCLPDMLSASILA